MGVVYRAERADGEFEQEVAVKLVREGVVGGEAVRRFRRERQILARLEHPNVARLLDGGVTEQGPYLVMEYVRGEPIDAYCEAHRLSLDERLELFATVCDAVHAAHRELIVHRDLKPENVLVNDRSGVKLLDFGIAGLLEEPHGGATTAHFGARPMTLQYASPEQLRGELPGTPSDVYSLGVLLYELLTGVPPFALAGKPPFEIARIVGESEPALPSSRISEVGPRGVPTSARRWRAALTGDLDIIALKALRREPRLRYESAAALRDDVRRYLERRPVEARPHSTRYRLSRFVRRHALSVAASGTLIAILATTAFVAYSQARAASGRFRDVRALANALLFDLHDEVRDLPGATAAREKLVSRALTYLGLLSAEAEGDRELQLELAAAYEQVGLVQGDPHYTNLGDLAGTLRSYREALRLREVVWVADPSRLEVVPAVARSYGRVAVATSWSGDNDAAIRTSSRALELYAELPPALLDERATLDRGRIRSELGWWLIWAGHLDEGLAHVEAAIAELEPLTERRPNEVDVQMDLFRAYSYALDGWRFGGRDERALESLVGTALPHLRRAEVLHPVHPRVLYEMHVALDFLGALEARLGNGERAAEAYEESATYARRLVDSDPQNQKAFEGLARAHSSWGRTLIDVGRFEEGSAPVDRAIEIWSDLLARNPSNVEYGNMVGNAHRFLCRTLLERDLAREALTRCLEASRTHRGVVAVQQQNLVVRGNLAYDHAFAARSRVALAADAPPDERRALLKQARRDLDLSLELLEGLRDRGALLEVDPEELERERRVIDSMSG
jgi:non-specific serine/threonine protein kinase/serine/threonine-protein kinase